MITVLKFICKSAAMICLKDQFYKINIFLHWVSCLSQESMLLCIGHKSRIRINKNDLLSGFMHRIYMEEICTGL